MMNLEFARPHYLWLLLVLIPIVAWYVVRRHKEPSLGVSSDRKSTRLNSSH